MRQDLFYTPPASMRNALQHCIVIPRIEHGHHRSNDIITKNRRREEGHGKRFFYKYLVDIQTLVSVELDEQCSRFLVVKRSADPSEHELQLLNTMGSYAFSTMI